MLRGEWLVPGMTEDERPPVLETETNRHGGVCIRQGDWCLGQVYVERGDCWSRWHAVVLGWRLAWPTPRSLWKDAWRLARQTAGWKHVRHDPRRCARHRTALHRSLGDGMAWSCRKRRRGAFRCRPSAGLYVQEQMEGRDRPVPVVRLEDCEPLPNQREFLGSQDPIKVAHPRRHPYSWRISEWTEE